MITSIAATSSSITVKENIIFDNNTAISGTGFIFSKSSVLIVSEHSNVVFRNNFASQYGAAFTSSPKKYPKLANLLAMWLIEAQVLSLPQGFIVLYK